MAFSDKTALVWSLSLLIFVFGTASSDAVDLSTNHTYTEGLSVDPITEIDELLSRKIVDSNSETCGSIGVCENGGSCVNEDGKSHCQCKKGTSGDRCEVVEECPLKCGNETGVKCSYNVLKQTAECLCNSPKKGFDSYKKKCRDPCKSAKDCPKNTFCRKNLDNELRFCKCPFGIGGDRCLEEIDECKAIGLDCGTNPNVTCEEEKKGKPVCYCEGSWSYAFNYEIKDCVECNCQGNNLGCKFHPGGEKECFCHEGWYYEDGICKDCECGFHSNGCQLKNGTKVCDCWYDYVQINTTCESCNCGLRSIGCSVENGEKICYCQPGYLPVNGTCKKNCSTLSGDKCTNGGVCKDDVCQCLPGTLGDRCEIIEGCEELWQKIKKCGPFDGMECAYNQTSQTSYCRCDAEGYVPDKYYKKCRECDCGSHGKCSFVGGIKTCDCEEGYADQPAQWDGGNQCRRCDCGDNSTGCTFPTTWTKECHCDKGFSERFDSCFACECGSNSTGCKFPKSAPKQCYCDEGYSQWFDECFDCECGPKSTGCNFNTAKGKLCYCEDGYAHRLGGCSACNCGRNSTGCSFQSYSKECYCDKGYFSRSGECKECGCGLNGECEVNEYREVICKCNAGYGVKDGKCTKCDCSLNGEAVNCTFSFGRQKCSCPKGYEEKRKTICTDIDECENKNICPSSTVCNNLIGSYECNCKTGFKPYSSTKDKKRFGCKDIDECEEFNECPYRDTTVCINTYGSYYCSCKTGFYDKYSFYSIEFSGCEKDLTGWKIGYIILIVAFIIVLFVLTIVICKRGHNI